MHKCLLIVLMAIGASLWSTGECKSIFGIGTRIFGDQLLLKDVQESRPAATSEQPTISFNYAIPEPITYIEILSDENIYAEVDFGYHDNLVTGIVRALKKHERQNVTTTTEADFAFATMAEAEAETEADETEIEEASTDASLTLTNQTTHPAQSFEIRITIYGFNDTILNVSPAYILNRDQQIEGVLKPFRDTNDDHVNDNGDADADDDDDDDDNDAAGIDESDYVNAYVNKRMANYELENGEARPSSAADDNDSDDDGGHDDGEAAIGSDYATTNGNDFEQRDKIIEIGKRQNGDFLIYETYQTSAQATAEGSNHTVVFYYIDSDFITYVKFVIFDHFAEKSSTDANYIAPVGEYSHYSPNTLKATITEYETTSLFVQMFIYGYRATAVPKSYEAFLLPSIDWRRNTAFGSNKMPLTVMQRLEKCLKGGVAKGTTATTAPSLSDAADGDDDDNYDDGDDKDDTTLSNLPTAVDLQMERILLAETMSHDAKEDSRDAANALTPKCMWTAILSLALLFHL